MKPPDELAQLLEDLERLIRQQEPRGQRAAIHALRVWASALARKTPASK